MAYDSSTQRSREGGESFAAVYHTPNKIWVAVIAIIVGGVICGVAFILHSVILAVLGGLFMLGGAIAAWSFDIMDNVH
ncbi:MAG: hypothetical protein ABJC62_01585 [Frankiaceae bacterium]